MGAEREQKLQLIALGRDIKSNCVLGLLYETAVSIPFVGNPKQESAVRDR